MSTYKKLYNEEIAPTLMKKFNYKSTMEIPKVEKIVINMGVGEAARDSKFIEAAVKDLELISGQKPVITKARKSIAGFKIREGQEIGAKVTLRGEQMYNFMEKLKNNEFTYSLSEEDKKFINDLVNKKYL